MAKEVRDKAQTALDNACDMVIEDLLEKYENIGAMMRYHGDGRNSFSRWDRKGCMVVKFD